MLKNDFYDIIRDIKKPPSERARAIKQGRMSKAKTESVAEIIARKKAESTRTTNSTPKTTKKIEKKKPATKKAGFIVGKKNKEEIRIDSDCEEMGKGLNSSLLGIQNPATYLAFIEFIATPTHLREIQTQQEFAKEFRISEDTLSLWKKRLGFEEDVDDARKRVISFNMLSTALSALHRKIIKEGNAGEVKLLYQIAGKLEERKVIEDKRPVRELTEEKKAQIAKNIENWMNMEDDDEEGDAETNE